MVMGRPGFAKEATIDQKKGKGKKKVKVKKTAKKWWRPAASFPIKKLKKDLEDARAGTFREA